jgi:hypothetical protein
LEFEGKKPKNKNKNKNLSSSLLKSFDLSGKFNYLHPF